MNKLNMYEEQVKEISVMTVEKNLKIKNSFIYIRQLEMKLRDCCNWFYQNKIQ